MGPQAGGGGGAPADRPANRVLPAGGRAGGAPLRRGGRETLSAAGRRLRSGGGEYTRTSTWECGREYLGHGGREGPYWWRHGHVLWSLHLKNLSPGRRLVQAGRSWFFVGDATVFLLSAILYKDNKYRAARRSKKAIPGHPSPHPTLFFSCPQRSLLACVWEGRWGWEKKVRLAPLSFHFRPSE